jgi:methionyl aminopeptidase
MVTIKSKSESDAMKQGGKILYKILQEVKAKVVPGITKKELDDLAKRLCLKYHVKPSFLGYNGYPAAICVSINNEVVHGLPSEQVIKVGDIVSLDMGVCYAGLHTDSALTFICGEENPGVQKLINVCEASFLAGLSKVKNGARIGDVSSEIQKHAESYGYGVIRMLVGHGIGKEVHEEPHVPNYGSCGEGPVLKTGMTIAIEPMITASGETEVILGNDGWTYFTRDGSISAHYEHTVLVTDEGYEVLTDNS